MANVADKLINLLKKKNKRVLITTGGNELRTRCPYCGDSRKNSSSAHMYISLNPPYMYHCFRCETSGCLNAKVLRDFDIDDSSLHIEILEASKNSKYKASKKQKKSINFNLHKYDINTAKYNLKYFTNRYNLNYDENDIDLLIDKYKIILDPMTFLSINKIDTKKIIFDFQNSIGFLSFDQNYAIFRLTHNNSKMRYINIPLIGQESDSKIYAISTNIDIMAPKVKFIMTEGIFDIIGVYEHFYKDKSANCIFIASCGKSYRTAIDSFVRLGFLDFDLIIYSDSDVKLDFYKDIKDNSVYLQNKPITIYYNDTTKDFGVPKDNIHLRKAVI